MSTTPAPIDTPAYPGNSPVRIVAVWHHGNDYLTREVVAHDTRAGLAAILPDDDMPAEWREHANYALGRPNDVHRIPVYDLWSWWRIVQVWAYDTRPAREILGAALRDDDTDRAQWHGLTRNCALSRAAHYSPAIAAILES